MEFNQIEESIRSNSKTNRKGKYKQFSDKDRSIGGKYARENGPDAAVSSSKRILLTLMKVPCTDLVRDTKRRFAQAKKDQRRTATILPTQKPGWLLILGKLGSLVQRYISAASNISASVITRSVVASTA